MDSIRKKITQEVFISEITTAMQNGASRFTLWFYPETTKNKRDKLTGQFQEYLLGRETIQPVTLYGGKSPKPVENSPLIFKLTPDSIDKMMSNYKEIVATCDSVATYQSKHPSFVCAVIFHENEIFLQKIDAKSNQKNAPDQKAVR